MKSKATKVKALKMAYLMPAKQKRVATAKKLNRFKRNWIKVAGKANPNLTYSNVAQ